MSATNFRLEFIMLVETTYAIDTHLLNTLYIRFYHLAGFTAALILDLLYGNCGKAIQPHLFSTILYLPRLRSLFIYLPPNATTTTTYNMPLFIISIYSLVMREIQMPQCHLLYVYLLYVYEGTR